MKKILMFLLTFVLVLTCICAVPNKNVQAATVGQTGSVSAESVNLRSGPGTSYSIVVVLKKGDKFTVKAVSGRWYKIEAVHSSKTYTGYVTGTYVSFNSTTGSSSGSASTTKTGTVTASSLNLRSGPGTSYSKVVALSKGDKVTIEGTSGNWYKVKAVHSGKTYSGYVSASYIKVTDSGSTAASEGKKVIYLTFDDGPGKYTEKLLNILDKYNVKATFFVTNQFSKYQSMIKEEAKRGHTVALHTYSHEWNIYKSESAYYADFNKMQDIIKNQTGSYASIIRFPGGSSNTVSKKYCSGIMTTLARSVQNKGYVYTDWNVDSNDAGGATKASEVAANVIAGCKKHDVSIVLQHDIKSYSVEAVEEIIKWGQKNGYTFKAMTPNSTMVHQKINN